MNHLAKPIVAPNPVSASIPLSDKSQAEESLFEHFAWIYIFCRERLFRDDTERMVRRLWPNSEPPPYAQILELGCGPGFYSRALARRFPESAVLGVDNCKRQLDYARIKAARCGVRNCKFERGNVLELSQPDDSFQAVIASRLFTILPERERALDEIFRILLPGGKCFIAEPRFAFSASIPLFLMRVLARSSGDSDEYREPTRATALSSQEFRGLFRKQPWVRTEIWRAGRYQYALCEKG
jgi:arsenite methyltransferase